MQPAGEAAEVFALLEGGGGGGALLALFGAVRDAWLARGLLAYHAGTGSARALDALARAPEPHARLLLDALAEQLAGDKAARGQALAALAPLVARRPVWLQRLPQHALLGQLLRCARVEPDPVARLNALLALAALAAHSPTSLPPGGELAEALLAAAAGPEPHAALAAHALFAALYAAAPAALVAALRRELEGAGGQRAALARGLPRLLGGARLLPLLLPGAEAERAEPPAPAPAPPPAAPASPPAGAAALASRAVAALRPPAEPWFPLGERCGADSAPHTPLPPEGALPGGGGGEGGSPPEAAVEATPENTPAKETRAQFVFPAEGGAARALGRLSAPPSPLRADAAPAGPAGGAPGGHAARLARVVRERAAPPGPPASPVPFGAAAPPQTARPEPRPALPRAAPDLAPVHDRAPEDQEVSELSGRAWPPPPPPPPPTRWRRPPARGAPPPRRARSCPPPAPPRAHAATQTVRRTPPPADFLIHDLYRSLPEDAYKLWSEPEAVAPSARLDAFLERLYQGAAGAAGVTGAAGAAGAAGELSQQLALTHALLMFERWRREAHAERNRRLLGRVRQARALELSCAALRDRVRVLARDVEQLRARRAPPPPPPPSPPPAPAHDALAQLAAQLAAERLARDTAEARLQESEACRAVETAELQRLRGAVWEAERQGEGQARAQAQLARSSELVQRLRDELLLLHEREHQLHRALQGAAGARAGGGAGAAAALRAARDEARAAREEGEAAAARAEGAAARARDLEAALAAKDGQLGELRRAARGAADEHLARLQALQDKYRALLHVQRRMELRALERAAAPAAAPPPHPS